MKKFIYLFLAIIGIISFGSCSSQKFYVENDVMSYDYYIENGIYFSAYNYVPFDFYEIGSIKTVIQPGIIEDKDKNKNKVDKDSIQNNFRTVKRTKELYSRPSEDWFYPTLTTFYNEAFLEVKKLGGDGVIHVNIIQIPTKKEIVFTGIIIKKK